MKYKLFQFKRLKLGSCFHSTEQTKHFKGLTDTHVSLPVLSSAAFSPKISFSSQCTAGQSLAKTAKAECEFAKSLTHRHTLKGFDVSHPCNDQGLAHLISLIEAVRPHK